MTWSKFVSAVAAAAAALSALGVFAGMLPPKIALPVTVLSAFVAAFNQKLVAAIPGGPVAAVTSAVAGGLVALAAFEGLLPENVAAYVVAVAAALAAFSGKLPQPPPQPPEE